MITNKHIAYAVIADSITPVEVTEWFKLYQDEITDAHCSEDMCNEKAILVYLNGRLVPFNIICAVVCEHHAIAVFGERAKVVIKARVRDLN